MIASVPAPIPARSRSRPPGLVDPDRRDDRHPVHGVAQAAGSDGGPDRRHHRHPHHLPRHPPAGPRLRPEVLRAGRRGRHLQRPGGRRALCLRLHRGRHPGLHGRIDRPHRGDVPPSGGDRPLAIGALPGPDTGRPGHRGAAGGHRVHHRLRGVRVRRTHPGQLPGASTCPPGCPRPDSSTGPPTTRTRWSATSTTTGARPRPRSSTTSSAPSRAVGREAARGRARDQQGPGRTHRVHCADAGDDQGRGGADAPGRTMRTTPRSSCPRRSGS